MVKPIRAKRFSTCQACGDPIPAGELTMRRFTYSDWVHCRDECIYSDQIILATEHVWPSGTTHAPFSGDRPSNVDPGFQLPHWS